MSAGFKVREQLALPLGLFVGLGFCLLAGAASEVCVGFGDLEPHAAYVVSNRFVSGSVTCEVERFQWRDGRWTSNGNARVEGSGLLNIGAQLPYLWLNNVNLRLDIPVATDLRLRYGAFGGNQNLRVNGAMTNFLSMPQVNGITLGGVEVILKPVSSSRGEMRCSGIISDFAIGGQEFPIDDVCITPYVGPKFRRIATGASDEVTLIFSYPGTDASRLVLKYADSLQPAADWSVDSNATITSTAANWFQAHTTRRPGMRQVFYRLEEF